MSKKEQIFLLYPNAKWGGCLTVVCQWAAMSGGMTRGRARASCGRGSQPPCGTSITRKTFVSQKEFSRTQPRRELSPAGGTQAGRSDAASAGVRTIAAVAGAGTRPVPRPVQSPDRAPARWDQNHVDATVDCGTKRTSRYAQNRPCHRARRATPRLPRSIPWPESRAPDIPPRKSVRFFT